MSQFIDYSVALTLKKGDVLYHNILVFNHIGEPDNKFPATCVITGKVKKVPGVEEFYLPAKRQYGDENNFTITFRSRDLWRTTPEKIVPVRIHRERSVPTHPVVEEPASDNEKTPVARVRRTRTTVTGRVVDDNATLLQNGQDQLQSLRVRRTRA